MMKYTAPLLVLCLLAVSPLRAGEAAPGNAPASPYRTESPSQRDARMKWFREARFGMFIHWGLYSEAAGYWDGQPTRGAGEWIMNDMQIPVSQYAKLVPEFNPVKFNARA